MSALKCGYRYKADQRHLLSPLARNLNRKINQRRVYMKQITRLKKYLEDFARQEDTISKLNKLCELADERKRCGFEKWLQFELYLFFEDQGIKVKIEKVTPPDRRSSSKTHFQVDIVVSTKSGDSLGLELKTRLKAASSIQALKKDIAKHARTKLKGKATANFAIVLCAEKNIDEKRKQDLINDKEKEAFELHIIDVGDYHFFIAEEK